MNRLCMGCMEEYDDRLPVCPHCGYAFDTPPEQSYHIAPGSVLEQRYIVGKVLGFGGFGVTYLGLDYQLGRKVAIKEYLPSEFATRMPTQQKVTIYSGDSHEQYMSGLRKVIDEAKRLAQFQNKPGIVQIYDCFEANETAYIVMEYLEGMSLKEYLRLHGKIPVEQALPLILQVISSMEEVHKAGILHRDIAPDNLYLIHPELAESPDQMEIKLLDFGAARYATTKHSKSLSVIIKPGFAPIEQYRSRGDQGPWTDVYALAATFYKMITGITPQDSMERSVKDELKRPSKMGIKISKPLETALLNALNIQIPDRTKSMVIFEQELMAAEVKRIENQKLKKDVGSVPKWVFALAGGGVVLLGAATAVLIITLSRLGGGSRLIGASEVDVPQVIGEQVTVAEDQLVQLNLAMLQDKKEYSNDIPADMISYQGLPAGTVVEEGTQVLVWVSLGKETKSFTGIQGISEASALQKLTELGFTNVTTADSQEEGVYGAVVEIQKEDGTKLAESEAIALDTPIVLKICRKQSTANGALALIPDTAGKRRAEAEKLMTDAGFKINWVTQSSSEVEKDMVISQDPKADTQAPKESFVTIYVSGGAESLQMANVELETLEDARTLIAGLGLKIGTETLSYSDSVPAGKVITQSIKVGTAVAAGDTVDLVVSQGADPAKKKTVKETTAAAKATEAARQTAAAKQTAADSGVEAQKAAAAAAAQQKAAADAAAQQKAAEAAQKAAAEAAAQQAAQEAAQKAAAAAAAQKAAEEAARQAAAQKAAEAAAGGAGVPDF